MKTLLLLSSIALINFVAILLSFYLGTIFHTRNKITTTLERITSTPRKVSIISPIQRQANAQALAQLTNNEEETAHK